MYQALFGLSGPPFEFGTSAAVLLTSASYRGALATLQRGLMHKPSAFTRLGGETGIGKITLHGAALMEHREGIRTVSPIPIESLPARRFMFRWVPLLSSEKKTRSKIQGGRWKKIPLLMILTRTKMTLTSTTMILAATIRLHLMATAAWAGLVVQRPTPGTEGRRRQLSRWVE